MQPKKDKLRRLLVMLPAFLAPLALLVYLIVGKDRAEAPAPSSKNGFNATLPAANISETGKSKLEIYMQAEQDSLKRKQELLNDPYEKKWFDPAPSMQEHQKRLEQSKLRALSESVDPNEKKINDRLDKLYREINKPPAPAVKTDGLTDSKNTIPEQSFNRLEQLMSNLQLSDSAPDPEMDRVESMLEKILDIQHPERLQKQPASDSDASKKHAYAVLNLNIEELHQGNGFYGLPEAVSPDLADHSTITATIYQNQWVRDGSVISFRLMQDVFVGNARIPRGSIISGKCSIEQERVHAEIREIAHKGIIYPVYLTTYDTDGIAGINVPGVTGSTVARNGINQAVQNVDIYSTNASVGAQAAASGVQALKGLVSQKVKNARALLNAGHTVLLKSGR
jgi:conjugative transposon TraM protein